MHFKDFLENVLKNLAKKFRSDQIHNSGRHNSQASEFILFKKLPIIVF